MLISEQVFFLGLEFAYYAFENWGLQFTRFKYIIYLPHVSKYRKVISLNMHETLIYLAKHKYDHKRSRYRDQNGYHAHLYLK